MATHLLQRLKRVERSMNRLGSCAVCDGRGKCVLSKIYEGDPEPPTPEGCPGCGEITHYVIRYVRIPILH